jgi:hypothetical protein
MTWARKKETDCLSQKRIGVSFQGHHDIAVFGLTNACGMLISSFEFEAVGTQTLSPAGAPLCRPSRPISPLARHLAGVVPRRSFGTRRLGRNGLV